MTNSEAKHIVKCILLLSGGVICFNVGKVTERSAIESIYSRAFTHLFKHWESKLESGSSEQVRSEIGAMLEADRLLPGSPKERKEMEGMIYNLANDLPNLGVRNEVE
jgi:hypothetical protein